MHHQHILTPDRSDPRFDGFTVHTVAPHRGFHLIEWSEPDSDGFFCPAWAARGDDGDVLLQVSRFFFTPTSARFAWLVDNTVLGSRRSGSGPWNDERIDAAIAGEASMENVRVLYGRHSPQFRAASFAGGVW